MNSRNLAFENSLRCLQHPLTLLSIATLLFNDHVLKVASPTWLTGKLSDFAGLFFFPFIVAAVLSISLSRFEFSVAAIGQIAFGLVAAFFALLKTIAPVNELTNRVASSIYSMPVHYSLDITDLFALFIMIPTWNLWIRQQKAKPSRTAYLALVIGALAAIATSPRAYAIYKVTNLEYYKDGIVYAADRDGWGQNSYPVAKSSDGGMIWEQAVDIHNIEEKGLPIKLCGHINPNSCFQVTKGGQLQESINDGENWEQVKLTSDFIAYDLILFEWEGKEYVVAAIGEHGILRTELPNLNWEKIGIMYASQ